MSSTIHGFTINRSIGSATRALIRCLLCSDSLPLRASPKLYKRSITSDITSDIIIDIP
jgi:hypothetical protein